MSIHDVIKIDKSLIPEDAPDSGWQTHDLHASELEGQFSYEIDSRKHFLRSDGFINNALNGWIIVVNPFYSKEYKIRFKKGTVVEFLEADIADQVDDFSELKGAY